MELDWSVDREGDASLVGVRVRNDEAVPRRVRIESRLDGAVLPPRRGGVPEAGWDAGGVTAVIDPGERETFGFATLADPVEPPVEIAGVAPATPGAADGQAARQGETASVQTAVRDLADHRPPRRAVAGAEAVDHDERGSDGADPGRDEGDGERAEPVGEGGSDPVATTEERPNAAIPAEIEAWFAAVEARIEQAERLTGADLATATAVVEEAGGLDAIEGLDERVAADAERLKAVRDRAAALAERADESEVPTEALEALA
ncbi:hypothetical protein ABNG02_01195 [Halorubrum ejinorense]|uniref:DUF8080 domain-containing protein n=1 Tax=Halorubrum ejinorense TaxID=425309 RepID=A0AAV3SNF6_9EURY